MKSIQTAKNVKKKNETLNKMLKTLERIVESSIVSVSVLVGNG